MLWLQYLLRPLTNWPSQSPNFHREDHSIPPLPTPSPAAAATTTTPLPPTTPCAGDGTLRSTMSSVPPSNASIPTSTRARKSPGNFALRRRRRRRRRTTGIGIAGASTSTQSTPRSASSPFWRSIWALQFCFSVFWSSIRALLLSPVFECYGIIGFDYFLLIRWPVFVLWQQSQLGRAVYTEDYEDAARLKVAIAAAATNDTVGRVMSHWNVWKQWLSKK